MAELPWIERTFQAAQKAAADAEDTSRVKIVYGGGVVVGSVHVTAQTNYDQFNGPDSTPSPSKTSIALGPQES